ncbi:50S ribosomal protein L9 [Pseudovibrio axinellae]|uniref:Large ribosomal subunit protein bL9 n=1 Tax=Pseudovibrio axinellae TaxID=989403 RepID=A0A165UKY2_9HYPH|nr:50S ribosomal protein L9 [Pseudovibrio axinellae]KZL12487.1 50S ribosomal protein L9 [Pseudovibrio axinellae]SEP70091.1 LSU ribosomal protein L9P [Pseudovibrio axinellae]
MKVILLERVAKLGQMGDTVTVRDGYARNFLLPQSKALRANKANLERFENERSQLEARNLERKSEAAAVGEKLAGNTFVVIRAAGETGQLYGSVATRDIAEILTAGGFSAVRSQVSLRAPIKTIGLHEVVITLHPEVEVVISINVARSTDEADRQAAGEDLTGRETDNFEFDEDLDEDEELEDGEDAGSEEGDSEEAGESDESEKAETEE